MLVHGVPSFPAGEGGGCASNLIGSKLDPILSQVLGPVSAPFFRHFGDPKRLRAHTSVTSKLGNSKIGWETKSGPVSGPLLGPFWVRFRPSFCVNLMLIYLMHFFEEPQNQDIISYSKMKSCLSDLL